MGLLDGLAGSVLSNMLGGGNNNSLVGKIAMEMLTNNGGLGGLLEKFTASGLGDVAASWVGQGDNASVSADQISNIFGNDQIADMASKFGLDAGDLTGQLAQFLPELVNQATPNGAVDDSSNDMLGSILDMLK